MAWPVRPSRNLARDCPREGAASVAPVAAAVIALVWRVASVSAVTDAVGHVVAAAAGRDDSAVAAAIAVIECHVGGKIGNVRRVERHVRPVSAEGAVASVVSTDVAGWPPVIAIPRSPSVGRAAE